VEADTIVDLLTNAYNSRSKASRGRYQLLWGVGLVGHRFRAVILDLTIGLTTSIAFIFGLDTHLMDTILADRDMHQNQCDIPCPACYIGCKSHFESTPKNRMKSHASAWPSGTGHESASFPLSHRYPDRGLEAPIAQPRGKKVITIGYADIWVQGRF
jgi:hypothetical protein